MQSHNIAKQKADLLEKEALSLLPRDKENAQSAKPILSVNQWFINQTEVNMLETDTVSSAFLLAQKWPFALIQAPRPIVYAFMAGNDTLAKGNPLNDQKAPKSLLNLMLLFQTEQNDQPYISMLAANSLLSSLKLKISSIKPQLQLHIRWKHDILLETMKVGEISLKHAKAEDKFYSQLSVEVNVKSIPRNFGAYDFQPTYLEKHTKENIDMSELAQSIINNLVRDLWEEETINERKEKIKEIYQKELIYMNQRVTIYDKKYEHIHYTGRFAGVDEEGNALLEEFKKPFEDGVMKFDSGAKDYLSLYRGDY